MSKYKYNNVKNYIADLARGGEASGFFHTRAQILTHLFSSHKISTKNEKKFPKNQRFHTIRICSDSSFSWVGAWLRTRTILRVKPVDPLSECHFSEDPITHNYKGDSSPCDLAITRQLKSTATRAQSKTQCQQNIHTNDCACMRVQSCNTQAKVHQHLM